MTCRDYRVGEVVLMEYQGWLKAFRVIEVYRDDTPMIEYKLAMLEHEQYREQYRWLRPS